MTHRNWVTIPATVSAALTIAIVVLSGNAGNPAGLLLVPLVAVATPFLTLPLAVMFTAAAAASLGGAYWVNGGVDGVARIAVEAPLIVAVAIIARYTASRLEAHAAEQRLLERIRQAPISSALLDNVYEDIYQALKGWLPADRFAIVVEKPGDDELEVAYASGVPVSGRGTGDVAPLVVDEDGWQPVGDGRVQIMAGGGLRPESNTAYLGAGLRSGIRVQLGSRTGPTGYLELRSKLSNAFSERDAGMLAVVASEVSLTIDSARYSSQVIRVGEERVSRMRLDAEKRALEETRRRLASMNEQLEVQNEIIRQSRERLVNAGEAARRAIAEELHGPIQTKLFMASQSLSAVRAEMDRDEFDLETLATSFDEALEQLERVREEDIRLLSHRLHPGIVRISALAGLRSLREFYESMVPISLDIGEEIEELEPAGASRIPESVRLAVHRVADAALANVVKHAGATECVIHWGYDRDNGELKLSITDDGCGFEPDARAPSGLGLITIRDYVDAIGGSLTVTSLPGKGTGVDVVIPFSDSPSERPTAADGDDEPAIGSILNMHWARPSNHPVSNTDGPGGDSEDDPDLPLAIGE
ncbi:MAG: hypothetical protein IIC92_05545 [Chloroflexi bacterium]|nr:hypothetical protein [Chloroflexota bacterium]